MGRGGCLVALGVLLLSAVGAELGSRSWDAEFGPFHPVHARGRMHTSRAPRLHATSKLVGHHEAVANSGEYNGAGLTSTAPLEKAQVQQSNVERPAAEQHVEVSSAEKTGSANQDVQSDGKVAVVNANGAALGRSVDSDKKLVQTSHIDSNVDAELPNVSQEDHPHTERKARAHMARDRTASKQQARFKKYEIDLPGEAQGGEVTVIERGVPSPSGNMMNAGASTSVADGFPASLQHRARAGDGQVSSAGVIGGGAVADFVKSGADAIQSGANAIQSGANAIANGQGRSRGSWQQTEDSGSSDTSGSGEMDDEQDDVPAPAPAPAPKPEPPAVEKDRKTADEGADEEKNGIDKAFDFREITYAEIPLHHWAWLTAVVFVMLTCIISLSLIVRHLEYYERPEVQKYVVRILFMAPLYAIDALLSLTFNNAAPYINVFRDCYEAFTIYNFIKMLFQMLGGERAVIEAMSKKKPMKMLFPFQWMEPWAMGDERFFNCKSGVMQYVLVIPICALVTFISGAAGAYEGDRWYTMDLWVQLVATFSATWAIYCLITFYMAMQEDLEEVTVNPLGKFLVIKGVVFWCFFQGIILKIVLLIGYIPRTEQFTAINLLNAVEQWLICFEMVIIAICFNLNFPVEEFADTGEQGWGFSSEYGTFDGDKDQGGDKARRRMVGGKGMRMQKGGQDSKEASSEEV